MGLFSYCATLVTLLNLFYCSNASPVASQMFIAEFRNTPKKRDIFYNNEDGTQPAAVYRYNGLYRNCTDDFQNSYFSPFLIFHLQKCCNHILNCPTKIATNKTLYGLRNTGTDPILYCECDSAFRDCLLDFPPEVFNIAVEIGKTRYNLRKQKCYMKIYRLSCSSKFFDEKGRSYDHNEDESYFCPALYTLRPF
ncbi:hypothetical protein KM043_011718 [Ampulex compressa]|uniref:Venom protein n=1 Tax=Ampulex compressa TaxID=860918 RepID=A0A1W6EVP0_AMPCP|nr:venom protein [Ampulex compressa]KAG7210157.1 hypothetical protein KM043_011718 [Ampulex compressa]